MVLVPFGLMLNRRARTFIGPTRQWASKMSRKNRVRDLMRKHGVEQSIGRTGYFHLPTDRCTVRSPIGHKRETGFSASVHSQLYLDRTSLRPRIKLVAQPQNRQLRSKTFCLLSHLLRQSWIGRIDMKVSGLRLKCSTRRDRSGCLPVNRHDQAEKPRQLQPGCV